MPEIVSRDAWLKARRALLRDEKALTRYRDYVAARRREMPWVEIDKPYRLAGERGIESLADLFQGRSQLIVYHFMYGTDWELGCDGCTQVADSFNQSIPYLEMRDISLVAVSRAPLDKLLAYRERMQWTFRWYSSAESDFNFDFHASYEHPETSLKSYNFEEVELALDESHGHSVFVRQDGKIYHTYSCYARSADALMMNLQYQDLTPFGRPEPDNVSRRA